MAFSAVVYWRGQNRASSVFAAELDIAALQRLTRRGETFLVYFYGRSCEDCAASEPHLLAALGQLRAAGSWPPGLPVYKCEREANATVRGLYGVEHTPTLLYFSAGAESARLEGPRYDSSEYIVFFNNL
jgi:thiol-disulfide isomerase/thioredoxin